MTLKSSHPQEGGDKRKAFKDMQEKQYPFSDSDVPRMLDDLLQVKLIELLRSRCLEDSKQVINPN